MNYEIPAGLTNLLQEFTVAVLRNKPNDLYKFAAEYFNAKANAAKSVGFNTSTISDDEHQAGYYYYNHCLVEHFYDYLVTEVS